MRIKTIKTRQKGFVIIVVLCMVILLTAMLLGFNYKSRIDLNTANRLNKSAQAVNCATAGLNIAIAAIASADDISTNQKITKLFSGKDAFSLDTGQCLITITEENGKINVNQLKDENDNLNKIRINQLLRLVDLLNRQNTAQSNINYSTVPSIIDWTDRDDRTTSLDFVKYANSGAENNFYRTLAEPYECKNAPLQTIDELLLIKGITPQAFEKAGDYLTIYGNGEININTAPVPVLECLSEKMDKTLANIIAEQRKIKPFEGVTQLHNVTAMTDGIYADMKDTITVKPSKYYYRVSSVGTCENTTTTILAVVEKDTENRAVSVILYKEFRGEKENNG